MEWLMVIGSLVQRVIQIFERIGLNRCA